MKLALKVLRFYFDGFAQMKLGRRLWAIIGLKLFIMFAVLKLLFFPELLKTDFNTDGERAAFVAGQLAGQGARASDPAEEGAR